MVLKGFPLELATAHNAVAALLLLSVVHLNRVFMGAIAGALRRERNCAQYAIHEQAT